jgi:putative transposase
MEKRIFFVTTVTWQRRSILQSDELARELLSTLFDYRTAGRFALHEFVIMPDHVHLLLTPAAAISLERTMQLIKGGFSYRVRKMRPNLMVWEKSFMNHRIRDERDYAQHRELCPTPEGVGFHDGAWHLFHEREPATYATSSYRQALTRSGLSLVDF